MSKAKPNPSSSAVDRRIAAGLHQQQIETIIRVEGIADKVDRDLDRALRSILTLVSSQPSNLTRAGAEAEAILREAVAQGTATMGEQFRRLIPYAHGAMAKVLARSVPRRWFAAVAPTIAATREDVITPEAPIPGDDPLTRIVDLQPEIEPVISGEPVSDKQWEKIVAEVIIPPPPAEIIEQILTRSVFGKTWQERMLDLSKKITNVDKLVAQMITGYAEGKNIAELAKSIEPLLGGIKSSARRIARTEGLRVAEQTQRQAWDGLGDMMLGVQILAVLDEHTRPAHAARNGKIYYRSASDGTPPIEQLPDLPDEPNCRCWSSPVLRPPAEIENSPAVAARFANARGAMVPDPAAYDQWFTSADAGRRKMAVGSKRYNAMTELLVEREPEWTDFIDSEGRLLSIDELTGETELERAFRKEAVRQSIRERESLLREVAQTGLVRRRSDDQQRAAG